MWVCLEFYHKCYWGYFKCTLIRLTFADFILFLHSTNMSMQWCHPQPKNSFVFFFLIVKSLVGTSIGGISGSKLWGHQVCPRGVSLTVAICFLRCCLCFWGFSAGSILFVIVSWETLSSNLVHPLLHPFLIPGSRFYLLLPLSLLYHSPSRLLRWASQLSDCIGFLIQLDTWGAETWISEWLCGPWLHIWQIRGNQIDEEK